MKSRIGWALALGISMLTSCASQDSSIAFVRPKMDFPPQPTPVVKQQSLVGLNATPVALADIRDRRVDPDLADLSDYALLASMAYDDEYGYGEVKNCEAVGGRGRLTASRKGWRRDLTLTDKSMQLERERGRFEIPGLGYSVWIQDGPPRRAAVVFRGTDFTQWGDWYSNLRWLTRLNVFTRDQYHQVRALVPQLRARIGPETEVIAIGHSLGGGLAQQAAYQESWIKKVYAFNTSPVTGSTSTGLRHDRQGLVIFRPYESGEILSGGRAAARQLVPLSKAAPRTMEVRFNFRQTIAQGSVGGGPFGQHRMRQLACDLVCWIDHGGDKTSCNVGVKDFEPYTPPTQRDGG